jgi:hypothetical protein
VVNVCARLQAVLAVRRLLPLLPLPLLPSLTIAI